MAIASRMSTRRRLLEAAADHFALAGCHGATVPAIARSARVSPAQVRTHFTSKEELFEAALVRAYTVLDGFSRRAEAAGEGLESVMRYVGAVLTDRRGRRAFHVAVWGLLTPAGGVLWPQPGFVQPLLRLVDEGQRDGSISGRHEAELLTLSVLAVLIQAASPLLEPMGAQPDVGEIEDYLRAALGAEAGGKPHSAPAAPGSGP